MLPLRGTDWDRTLSAWDCSAVGFSTPSKIFTASMGVGDFIGDFARGICVPGGEMTVFVSSMILKMTASV